MHAEQINTGSENEKGYIPISELLFLIIFSVLLIIHCIGNTSLIYSDVPWMDAIYVLQKIMYLALLVKIVFFSSYQIEELFFLGIILLIAFASLLGSRDFDLFELFLLAAASKKINTRNLVSCFAVIKGLSIIVILILWKVGIIPALYYWNSTGYYNTFGFCHRNVLGANIAIVCLAWFFLRYNKLKFTDVLLWFGIGLILYRFSYSRSGMIMVFLVSFGVYVFHQLEDVLLNIRNMRQIILGIFLFFLIISLCCMFFYSSSSPFWVALDQFFTTRVRSVSYFYHEYGFSMFGQDIDFVSSMEAQLNQVNKLILDNTYIRLIIYYGLVPAAMFFYVYLKALGNAFDEKDGAVLIGLLLFAVYGLSERYMMTAYYQFPLIVAIQSLGKVREGSAENGQRAKKFGWTAYHQRKP